MKNYKWFINLLLTLAAAVFISIVAIQLNQMHQRKISYDAMVVEHQYDKYERIVIVNSQTNKPVSWANEAYLDKDNDRIIVTNPKTGPNAGTFGMCYVHIVAWSDYIDNELDKMN